jgi:ribosomal protein S11
MNKKKTNGPVKPLNKYALKKKGHGIDTAYLCITATSNNAILSLTSENGGVIKQISCGMSHKNAKKSTPYAFQTALTKMIESIKDLGIFNIQLKIHTTGITHVREYLVALADQGFNITKITDLTSRNHNGARKPVERKP